MRKNATNNSQERFHSLEAHLAGTLKPIKPRGDFVQRIRSRIPLPEPGLIAERVGNWHLVLIVVGSVMSVAVLIATVARALFHFFGRRGGGAAV
jgi:hypothetical protein